MHVMRYEIHSLLSMSLSDIKVFLFFFLFFFKVHMLHMLLENVASLLSNVITIVCVLTYTSHPIRLSPSHDSEEKGL